MATIEASSADSGDVQDAIDAASAGDTVTIPADDSTWTTPGSGLPAVEIDKAINLIGAGEGSTNITCATNSGWDEVPILIQNISSGYPRISGITWDGTVSNFGVIAVNAVRNFRLDNMTFDGISGKCICTRNRCYGVIHTCTSAANITGFAYIKGDNNTSWARATGLGGTDFVFIEDCTLVLGSGNDGVIDGVEGGKCVFRYNYVEDAEAGFHGADSNAPPVRGMRAYEIYENSFVSTGSVWRCIAPRGGTGVIYNNTITGTWQIAIQIANYRTCGLDESGWLKCDGTTAWDGNETGEQGWPCRDQIGRGVDSFEWASPTSAPYPDQASEPLYQWGNTLNGNPVTVAIHQGGCSNPSEEDHLEEGRDYYDETEMPNYTPYTYPHPLRGTPEPTTSKMVMVFS